MAKEYIEREVAIETLYYNVDETCSAVVSDFEAIPAADVAEVVHGKWIKYAKYSFGTMYDCSICSDRILDNGHSWNYCPNCGAKMGGEIADLKSKVFVNNESERIKTYENLCISM